MLDSFAAPKLSSFFDKVAGKFLGVGIGATKLTLIGFILGLIGCFCVGMQQYIPGLALLILSQIFDGIDGAAARQTTITEKGALLDTLCDFIIYAAFPLFFIMAGAEHAIAGAFLLVSYVAMMCSYLLHCQYTKKGIPDENVSGGIIGHTEMIVFMILCCLYPPGFSAFSAVFGMACLATAILRVMAILKFLK